MFDLATLLPKSVHFPMALDFTGSLFGVVYLLKKKKSGKLVFFVLLHTTALSDFVAVITELMVEDSLIPDRPGYAMSAYHNNLKGKKYI